MTGFLSKKLSNTETLGEKLRKYRLEKGLSEEKAARAININVGYIKNIEQNNYDKLLADVYTTNILKSYAQLLDLNPATVVDVFIKEKTLFLKIQRRNQTARIDKLTRILNRLLNPKLLKYLTLGIILTAIFFYIGFEINKIVSPPKLIVYSPPDNLITEKHQIEIRGQTEKEVSLTINNRPLFSDKEGNFNLELDLQNGLNIIKIAAQKKHSKEQVIYRQVIVEEKK